MTIRSEVWKGLSGADRLVIVDRLFALSRGVLEWKAECESGEARAWAWYGKLDTDVYFLMGGLREVMSIDGESEWTRDFEREVVVRKLDELGRWIGDWAEKCVAGKAVAWIGVGRLAEYVERIWDQIYGDGKGNAGRFSLTVVTGSGKSRNGKLRS